MGEVAEACGVLPSLLYGVGAVDPLTLVAAPLILAVITLAACPIPSRRPLGCLSAYLGLLVVYEALVQNSRKREYRE